MNEKLVKLARKTLWTAFVWNDHNFKPAHEEARKLCKELGINSLDEANAFLDSLEKEGNVKEAIKIYYLRDSKGRPIVSIATLADSGIIYYAVATYNPHDKLLKREGRIQAKERLQAKEYAGQIPYGPGALYRIVFIMKDDGKLPFRTRRLAEAKYKYFQKKQQEQQPPCCLSGDPRTL
jgi:hypothetical protein